MTKNDPDAPGDGAAPCFLRGTRILTPAGEVPVEELRPGATVFTLGGARRAVAWIGRRRLDLRRHPDPRSIWPVRVRRGAIANGVPARDLLVSPSQGLLLSNLLLPAQALVNGATVLRDGTWQHLDYFAVALDAHDVMLADAAPAESFPEGADRSVLGGGAVMALHPRFAPPAAAAADCALRVAAGPMVEQARRALLVRARVLGHAITREPDLHLLVDGERIEPAGTSGALYRFAIPPGAADIRILSRAGVPAETDPASEDWRRLGVLLGRIGLRTERQMLELSPADPSLSEGFHPPERYGLGTARWTDGHARLPPAPPGLVRIELLLLASQPSWARATPPDAPIHRSA
jgi:hypothetical protein